MKADDADVRERASALWETIQRDLMTRPSMVRLDGENRPLSAVLADLETQTGLTLRREPSDPDRPVALREPASVSFWTALERLGLWGVYYQNPGEGRFPMLHLSKAPAPAFTSTDGPFRVSLRGLHLHRDRQLIRGPWVRIDRNGQWIYVPSEELKGETVTFFGGLAVMVEPRMWFTQEAPARLIEASDDLGQSLVPDAAGLPTTAQRQRTFRLVRRQRRGASVDRVPPPAHGPPRPRRPAARRRPRHAPRPPSRADARHPAGRRRREDIPSATKPSSRSRP